MKKQIYYHIHRYLKNESPFFKVGENYRTFEDYNNFWKFYLSYRPFITFDDMRLISPAKYADECVQQNQIHPVGLKFLADAIKESGMLIRELIFEDVRRKNFPHLPSRQSCLWLTEKDNIDFWFTWLNDDNSNFSIIELECEGIFHKGNQSFLNSDIDGYNKYSDNASNYWNSTNVETMKNNEIIFNGCIKVLKVENKTN